MHASCSRDRKGEQDSGQHVTDVATQLRFALEPADMLQRQTQRLTGSSLDVLVGGGAIPQGVGEAKEYSSRQQDLGDRTVPLDEETRYAHAFRQGGLPQASQPPARLQRRKIRARTAICTQSMTASTDFVESLPSHCAGRVPRARMTRQDNRERGI